MQIIRRLSDIASEHRGGGLTIGNFDGVHRGHAAIIRRMIERSRQLARPAVVFTFDPHPVRLLRPHETPPPLTWTDRKAELLAALGVDVLVVYPTDQDLLALSAADFFQQIVRERLGSAAMVEGENFFFGRGRRGDVATLAQFCQAAGMSLEVVPPVLHAGLSISSSRIRRCVAAGEVAVAAAMLTAPYRIRGMVTHGAGRGAKIGFPTANLEAVDTLVPAPGVYAGWARGRLEDAATTFVHRTAVHIGPNPTFGENAVKIEAHLLDFDASLYHQPLEIDFVARIRDVQPFAHVDALIAQLGRDVQRTRELVGQA